MDEENKVLLYGTWVSPYYMRVELALKVKGIPYKYVEENLLNKSPELLKYNPIHKKVPVLVHNGKPVLESFIILEYIDEIWKNEPNLFPQDSYERSQVRFWASYINQLTECLLRIFKEEENMLKEYYEKVSVLEDAIKNSSLGISTSVQGRNMGVLDIMIIAIFGTYKAFEEVFGVKILDQEKAPLLYTWVTTLTEVPIVQENAHPQEKVVSFYRFIKDHLFKASQS